MRNGTRIASAADDAPPRALSSRMMASNSASGNVHLPAPRRRRSARHRRAAGRGLGKNAVVRMWRCSASCSDSRCGQALSKQPRCTSNPRQQLQARDRLGIELDCRCGVTKRFIGEIGGIEDVGECCAILRRLLCKSGFCRVQKRGAAASSPSTSSEATVDRQNVMLRGNNAIPERKSAIASRRRPRRVNSLPRCSNASSSP